MSDNDFLKKQIFNIVLSIADDKNIEVLDSTPLIGPGAILDSMSIVELGLALEDLGLKNQFEFDWTSSTSLFKQRSMFKTAGSLYEEFVNQKREKHND